MAAFIVVYKSRTMKADRSMIIEANDAKAAKEKADQWFGMDDDLVWERTIDDTTTARYLLNSMQKDS